MMTMTSPSREERITFWIGMGILTSTELAIGWVIFWYGGKLMFGW